MTPVSEIIIQKIKKEGPVPFRDFMEMALYYPELGYYTSSIDRIGKTGDYYTSPYLTSIFGALIGKQIEEMWMLLGSESFTIVEYGAGTGSLCNDILNYLEGNSDLYEKLHYCIIERNAIIREKQKLIRHPNVSCYNSIEEISPFAGCVLSNELLDNFSVHQVVMGDELMEVCVDYENDFVEVLRPASAELRGYFEELNIFLPKGYRTEINLQARTWVQEIANALKKGFVLTVDYGFLAEELYNERRRLGTLVCYHQHKINGSPYVHIGEQDITAHVNFSALHQWGLKNGLQLCGFTDQGSFLRSLGLVQQLRVLEQNGNFDHAGEKERLFFIHTLLMDLGRKLKVLIQRKNVEQKGLLGLSMSSAFSHFAG